MSRAPRFCQYLSFLTLVAGILFSTGALRGGTLYVDPDATSTPHDGSSWCNAYLTLQEALDGALPGDTVYVANGTYTPDPQGLSDPRDATFHLLNGVTIVGGHAGCGAPVPDLRDLLLHETILTGDLNGDDGSGGGILDNCYHVVTAGTSDATAVLDGFTVTGGNSPELGTPESLGGGLQIVGGSPTINNCTFAGNLAGAGGGVANTTGNPTLSNCTFTGNMAGNIAGGVYNLAGSPNLIGCAFTGNLVDHPGAGMADMFGSANLVGCVFSGNWSGESGGGMYVHAQGAVGAYSKLTNCLFYGNSAGSFGGGLYNKSGATLINCTFTGNSAATGGGAYHITFAGNLSLTNCILWGNSDNNGMGESAQLASGFGTVNVEYCCIQGWTGALGGTGNFDADPLFVDPGADDYHLAAGSPCADTGDNSAVPVSVTLDLYGNPRVACCTVDIGAHEYEGGCPIGTPPTCEVDFVRSDANASGAINLGDAMFTLSYLFSLGPASCVAALDSNDDDALNVSDVVYTLQFLFVAGTLPPPPYPDCGPDATPGALGCDEFPACP